MQRILDAAAEIAGERGYEATSIALVSERSGLPASSIYWHFANKDELIAAVIARSFERWRAGMKAAPSIDPQGNVDQQITDALRVTAKALIDAPDFLRLGLMLTLERRPEPLKARDKFLEVREIARRDTVDSYGRMFGDRLRRDQIRLLATLAMAGADGLFVAHEVEHDRLDLGAAFEAWAAGLLAIAQSMIASNGADAERPKRAARSPRSSRLNGMNS